MFKTLSSLYRRGLEIHRPLTLVTAILTVLSFVSAALIFLDPRVITGAPAWVKPTKFFISIAIYDATWLWLVSRVPERTRLIRWTGNINAYVGALEIFWIATQAARGIRSHFNASHPFDQVFGMAMGLAILILWLTNAAVAIHLLRKRFADPVLGWGIRVGVLATVVGMAVGFPMFQPKPEQKATMVAGHKPAEIGGHAVGAPDDGPGYFFVGWSKTGGDWRPGHFVGLHGLQVLPLVAWLVSRRRRGLSTGHQVALVGTAGFAYVGLIGVLVSQAVRAQPVFRPDAVTLGMLGALLAVVAASAAAIAAHARLSAARVSTEPA